VNVVASHEPSGLLEPTPTAAAMVHSLLWAAPDHLAYAVLEADSLGVIAQYVNAIPIRQEFRVTPVEPLQQVTQTIKAMMARAKK
jgi:hypothetical protein